MSDFECYECGTVTADDERVWIATKCVCGEGEDCAECGYDVCMKCEDMCNKREAEDGNAREYNNDEEERKLIAAYLDSFLNKRGKGGGKCDGDGFVICSKCDKGGGKCDGDCEESK